MLRWFQQMYDTACSSSYFWAQVQGMPSGGKGATEAYEEVPGGSCVTVQGIEEALALLLGHRPKVWGR